MTRLFSRDATHGEIVDALRGCGFRVWDLAPYRAAIDLLVMVGDGPDASLYLVDAKAADGSARTPTQRRMVDEGWPVIFAATGQQAVDAIMARRRGQLFEASGGGS